MTNAELSNAPCVATPCVATPHVAAPHVAAPPCAVALKEWSVTCRALEEGRQIVLLRKGGLQDEDGLFSVEHDRFWLLPTYLHQEEKLVLPQHRDLFPAVQAARLAGENQKLIALRLLAEVRQVFPLTPEHEDALRAAPHIWSGGYLETRFDYRPEKPLLGVLLRVFARREPHVLPFRSEYFGCRSWIELPEPVAADELRPVLDDAQFAAQMREWQTISR